VPREWWLHVVEERDALKVALSKIRFAGNNADATAVWMQKVAAHATEPAKWPDPGSPPDPNSLSATMRDALVAARRLFDEALPQFDWAASALDANAIRLLNEVPDIVARALAQAGAP